MKKWFTEPNFIYGLVMGLAFSVLAAFLIITEVFTFGVLGLMVILAFFIAGALLGSLSARFARRKVGLKAKELLPQLAELSLGISFDVSRAAKSESADEVKQLLEQHSHSLRELVKELSQWIGMLYLRMLAFGSLFTMLGLMISFAVFWATFLQVTRLEEQIETTKTAKKIDIALSIASNYQFLVSGFINEVQASPNFGGSRYLTALQYKRLESTLRQLRPYKGVDVNTSQLATEANSPEQTFLLQFLVSNGIELPASKILLQELAAHNLDIQHGELSRADFFQSDLRYGRFYKSEIRKTTFNSAQLDHAKFLISSLNGADFSHASLVNADFTGSDLTQVSFANANLQGANFEAVGEWQTITAIKGANITGIKNAPEGFIAWAVENGAINE